MLLVLMGIYGTLGAASASKECSCVSDYLKADSTNLTVSEAFIKYGITPRYVPLPPKYILQGNLATADVNLGNFVPPVRAYGPKIMYSNGTNNANYTTMIIDIDSAGSDPALAYIVALNINVPKNNNNLILDGDSIVSVGTPMVTLGSGMHRVVGLLYEQRGLIDPNEQELFKLSRTRIINLSKFTRKYHLQGPTAGNFYRTELDYCDRSCNDRSCEQLCKLLSQIKR